MGRGSQGGQLHLGVSLGLGSPGDQTRLPASAGGWVHTCPMLGGWAEWEGEGASHSTLSQHQFPTRLSHSQHPESPQRPARGTAPTACPRFPPLNLELLRPPLPKLLGCLRTPTARAPPDPQPRHLCRAQALFTAEFELGHSRARPSLPIVGSWELRGEHLSRDMSWREGRWRGGDLGWSSVLRRARGGTLSRALPKPGAFWDQTPPI